MSKYENLVIQAASEGALVIEVDLGTPKKCGKYLDNIIIINSNLTDAEKYEILAEELGHHRTTIGNITDQSDIRNVKSEKRARREGYKIMLKPIDLINAKKSGVKTLYELAEYLEISPEILSNIINEFKIMYGGKIKIGDSYINLINY